VAELPFDLLADSFWPVGGGKSSRLGRVGRSTEGVCSHVRNGSGLPSCSGGSCRGRTAHLTSSVSSDEAAADFSCDAELATGKSPRSGD
jgi:hypothetical protein